MNDLRPFDPAGDRGAVESLWQASLAPTWPVLPLGIDRLRDGIVATGPTGSVIGFVATAVGRESTGIPLLMVAPDSRRRGLGTALVDAAVNRLSAAGGDVHAGSGGDPTLWPGVPLDLPAAVAFFTALGWHSDHDCADLTQDLRDYRDLPAAPGVRTAVAGVEHRDEVLAFEAATFPQWLRFFADAVFPDAVVPDAVFSHAVSPDAGASDTGSLTGPGAVPAGASEGEEVLTAHTDDGTLVGTLLFGGPDFAHPYRPMLGPAAGLIGCVGVAPSAQGRGIGSAMVAAASGILRDRGTRTCLIDWVVRESFYGRVGYRPWRRYRMFRRTPG